MRFTQLLDLDREYDSIAHGLYEADRQLDRAAVKERPTRTDAIRDVLLQLDADRCHTSLGMPGCWRILGIPHHLRIV